MAETVLVTGGAGFIGSHVARQLAERGDRVVLFDQPPRRRGRLLAGPVEGRVTFVQGAV